MWQRAAATIQAIRGRSTKKKIIQRNVQQPMLRAQTGRSSKKKITLQNVQQPMLRAQTGRSPKGNIAQGNTLGVSSLTNWRAVSATGASEMLVRSPSFCSFRAQVCWNIFTQGAALGCILIGLSARLCSQHQLLYAAMGYTPVDLSARLCSQHQHLYAAMGYTSVGLSARLCGIQPLHTNL